MQKLLENLRGSFPDAEIDGKVVAGSRTYGTFPRISFYFSCFNCPGSMGCFRKVGDGVMKKHLESAEHKDAVRRRIEGGDT